MSGAIDPELVALFAAFALVAVNGSGYMFGKWAARRMPPEVPPQPFQLQLSDLLVAVSAYGVLMFLVVWGFGIAANENQRLVMLWALVVFTASAFIFFMVVDILRRLPWARQGNRRYFLLLIFLLLNLLVFWCVLTFWLVWRDGAPKDNGTRG